MCAPTRTARENPISGSNRDPELTKRLAVILMHSNIRPVMYNTAPITLIYPDSAFRLYVGFLAQGGRARADDQCPLIRVKQTWRRHRRMSDFDPEATLPPWVDEILPLDGLNVADTANKKCVCVLPGVVGNSAERGVSPDVRPRPVSLY